MKFENIDALDAKIEKTVRREVKHYYTDWKNYDRPKYMKYKGSRPGPLVLLVRDCGTYLLPLNEIKKAGTAANTIYEYYTTQQIGKNYLIDINNLTFKKM